MKKLIGGLCLLSASIMLMGCSKKKDYDFKYDGEGYGKGYITYYHNSKKKSWYEAFKEEEIYDQEGKQLYHVFYSLKDGKLRLKCLHTYKYDENNLLIEKDVDEYYIANGKEVVSPSSRIEYAYEGTTLTEEIGYSKDYLNGGILSLSTKINYTYDSRDNLTKEVRSSYNSNNSTWVEFNVREYTYDSSNNKLSYTSTGSIFGECKESIVYSYDSNNNLIKKEYEYEDSSESNKSETIYVYENNLLKKETTYDIATDNSKKELYNVDYTYNSNNDVSTKLTINNSEGYSFIYNEKEEYIYDSNNELKTYIHNISETNPDSWYANRKYEYFTKTYKKK